MARNIEQIELFNNIEPSKFTYFAGWSQKAQIANANRYAILNSSMAEDIKSSEKQTGQSPATQSDIANEAKTSKLGPITYDKENETITVTSPITRRQFLKGSAIAAGSVAAGAAANWLTRNFGFLENKPEQQKPESSKAPESTPNTAESPSFILGQEQNLSLNEFGLGWTPDGHITYFTTPEGKKRYFISAGVSTWMIETDGKKSLEEYRLKGELKQEQFHQVLKPYEGDNFDINGGYKNGYTGITSVIQIEKEKDPMHLVATTHYEQRSDKDGAGSYTASVGLVESFDGGLTWDDKGPIIKGRAPIPPGQMPSGAGQPAAIVKDGYLHVMYIEWNTGADQLYSAKMKINNDATLGPVENITDENGKLKPLIPLPQGQSYAALPSVSYNEKLGKYLCVFQTIKGYQTSVSDDLVSWSEAKEVYNFSEHNAGPFEVHLDKGQSYNYYPTYLSEEYEDDHTTGENGTLYFATRTIGEDSSHNLKSINVQLKA